MKLKLLNGLLIIDVLTVLILILNVFVVPAEAARIVLGLPFLLYFPGYTLMAALFPINRRDASEEKGETASEGIGSFERTALSFGMSIAVSALLGLGLNYTPWGIRLDPIIYSISAFIFMMSFIAIMRRKRLPEGFKVISEVWIKMPGWSGSTLNKTLTVILAVCIVGSIGVLGYTIAKPKTGEQFSEFYILGNAGKADNYPSSFVLNQGGVARVSYDGGKTFVTGTEGRITVGIVNQELKTTSYILKMAIDSQPVTINYNGNTVSQVDQITLQEGEKWEQVVGFVPLKIGNNQKVEFFLYKDGANAPDITLHIWISSR